MSRCINRPPSNRGTPPSPSLQPPLPPFPLTTPIPTMQLKLSIFATVLATLSATQVVTAGPVAYGICQTGASSPPQSY